MLSAQLAHVPGIRDAAWKTATGIGPLIMEVTRPNSDRRRPEEIRSASGHPSSTKTPTLGEPVGQPNRNRPHFRNARSRLLRAVGDVARNSEPQAMLGKTYTKKMDDAMCNGRRSARHQDTHCANNRLPRFTTPRYFYSETTGRAMPPTVTLHAGRFLRGPKIMAADLDGPTPNVNRYRNPHADTASKPV